MFELFLNGLLGENIVLKKALGLALFAAQCYTMKEALWTCLRFSLFLSLMVCSEVLISSYLNNPFYFLTFMAALMGIYSVFLNVFLPSSVLESQITGIIRRGDPLVFLGFSAIKEKGLPLAESLIFTAGEIFGVIFLLILMVSLQEMFNLHRQSVLRSSSWKLGILGILSFLVS